MREVMVLIAGQRQRHSPSIGIRVVGIEVRDVFARRSFTFLSPGATLQDGHVQLSIELKTKLHTSYPAGKGFLYFSAF